MITTRTADGKLVKITAGNVVPGLTENEVSLIRDIVQHNEYGERGCLDNMPWSWAVCETKSRGAILGSLIAKGLAHQNGRGNDASCGLTLAGKLTYLREFGPAGVWSNDPRVGCPKV